MLAGNGNSSCAVQLLQLAETALLLDDAEMKRGDEILSPPHAGSRITVIVICFWPVPFLCSLGAESAPKDHLCAMLTAVGISQQRDSLYHCPLLPFSFTNSILIMCMKCFRGLEMRYIKVMYRICVCYFTSLPPSPHMNASFISPRGIPDSREPAHINGVAKGGPGGQTTQVPHLRDVRGPGWPRAAFPMLRRLVGGVRKALPGLLFFFFLQKLEVPF